MATATSKTQSTKRGLKRPPLEECSHICMAVLMKIDKDREELLPTPEIGLIIGWAPRYLKRQDGQLEYRAAIVTQILDPGRIVCQVFGESQTIIASSATYIHHPENFKHQGTKVGSGGGWFYLDILRDSSWQPPKATFGFHSDKLNRREQLCLQDEEKRVQDALERERLRARQIAHAPPVTP